MRSDWVTTRRGRFLPNPFFRHPMLPLRTCSVSVFGSMGSSSASRDMAMQVCVSNSRRSASDRRNVVSLRRSSVMGSDQLDLKARDAVFGHLIDLLTAQLVSL
jgi:hypothetical protein